MELKIAVSPGELIDRLTILEIKRAKIRDSVKLHNVNQAYESLNELLRAKVPLTPRLTDLINELASINKKLWEAEDDLRDFERRQIFDDRFIQIARSVYVSNDHRSELKREIDELLNSPLIEEKYYRSLSECGDP
jgi:hypothetical protein